MQKPFLKWAGNKYKQLPLIIPHLPTSIHHYYEPFLGSGAMLLNLPTKPEKAFVVDINIDVIATHFFVFDQPDSFKLTVEKFFEEHPYNKDIYYKVRDEFNQTEPYSDIRSAMFIWLNRNGFNGLCRYNSNGQFNVPFGQYTKSPRPPAFPTLDFPVKFKAWDYQDTLASEFTENDLIYVDSPYITEGNNFTQYHGDGWNLDCDQRLAKRLFDIKAESNPHIFVSNSNTKTTRELYKNAKNIFEIPTYRNISADSLKRGACIDLLIEV